MTALQAGRAGVEERRAAGEQARLDTPPAAHEGWGPAVDRADPVALLDAQNLNRDADLVPVRHGRMMVSPFTFYRGAAAVMAEDLVSTPTAGLTVQLCGDAHLSNFGLFGSPERALVFDVNDFDETLPGPFEYDVLRLAASLTVAARDNGFSVDDARDASRRSVRGYRQAMAKFAEMRTLDVWYSHLSEKRLMEVMDRAITSTKVSKAERARLRQGEKRIKALTRKARSRDSLQALSKLGELVDGRYRIVSDPPFVVPLRDLAATYGLDPEVIDHIIHEQLEAYCRTLPDDRRHLVERFEVVDVARKVVGVGSVGTRSFIALLQGRDQDDPLFLQLKEATASVLERHLPASTYAQPGERVVQGQRMMQAASDIFLGWTEGVDPTRSYYWRQLRDMKGSVDVSTMVPAGLALYGAVCGWTLAHGHARSGDPVAIAAYLGGGDDFDRAVADFSERYADQNESDYEAFREAVRSGRIEATDAV